MASTTNDLLESTDDYIPPVKLKKSTNEEDHNDLYCFECHDEGDVICCDSCPRVYHSKCLGLMTLPEGDWTCPECKISQCTSMTNNKSSLLKLHSVQEFHTMLKFALRRMKSHPQAAPFMQPVDPQLMPEYLDYIIHPMDLETIEKNIDEGKYTSTDGFIADAKWITHNSVVFNGSQSKFTGIARALLKIARHEMAEIEICSECYLHSAQPSSADWFAVPCTVPHALCWAKMKGYQPWPAKVLRVVNDEVDVRFFGQHDRAWVSINNCLLLSKEYPGVEKKKASANFEKSLSELQIHIDRLKILYGQFTYAPQQTLLSKTKPFKFVSAIDDTDIPSYVLAGTSNSTLRSSVKCVKQARSPIPSSTSEMMTSAKPANKRPNETSNDPESEEPVKRARVLSRPAEDNGPNSSRIVLRIRKTSEDVSTSRSDPLLTTGNNAHQLTVEIKEPLGILREDEENITDNEPPSSTHMFDLFDTNETNSVNDTKEIESSEVSTIVKTSVDSTPEKCISRMSPIVQSNMAEVRLTINALLDAIDALKSISEVRNDGPLINMSASVLLVNHSKSAHPPFAERRITTKHPRKSRLQHRITTPQPKPIATSIDPVLNEPSLSPSPALLAPGRPLSISPTNTDTTEEMSSVTNDEPAMNPNRPLQRTTSIESSNVKSEPMDTEGHEKHRPTVPNPPLQPASATPPPLSAKSFLISPPVNPTHHKSKPSISSNAHVPQTITNSNNTFAPRIPSTVSQKTIWPTTLPMASSIRQVPSATQKRQNPLGPIPTAPPMYPATASRHNNTNSSTMRMTPPVPSLQPQSFDTFPVNPPTQRRPNGIPLTSNTPSLSTRNPPIRMPTFNNHPVRPPLEDHQTPAEIQTIIKNFNDKFQQLLADFTVKIDNALESNRQKYEKELEETRRSYRMSMNELRTITTQQVQEMHNSLELQYWTRMTEMRNRYESTLQQQQLTKAAKYMNGAPR